MDLLQTFDELMRPVIHHYGGRIVKTIGDAYMTVFESPTDAVLCAIRMQYVLRGYNKARAPEDQIHLRVAVNTGEVQITGDGDVFGEAVNLTARVAGITEPDQIYLTERVYFIMNRNEVPDTLAVKKFNFKGIAEEVTIYRVVQNEDNAIYSRIVGTQLRAAEPPPKPGASPAAALLQQLPGRARRLWDTRRGVVIAAAAVLLVVVGWLAFRGGGGTPAPDAAVAAPSASGPAAAPRTRATASATPAPPPPPAVPQWELDIQGIQSGNDTLVRETAKRAVRVRPVDLRVLKAAAEVLQKGALTPPTTDLQGSELHADAMGWLCNLLGQSEGTEYVALLCEVAAQTPQAKTKRYALQNAEALERRAARAASGH